MLFSELMDLNLDFTFDISELAPEDVEKCYAVGPKSRQIPSMK